MPEKIRILERAEEMGKKTRLSLSGLKLCCVVFLLSLPPLPVVGDTILLKNGNTLEGEVVNIGPQKVLLKLPFGVLSLDRKQIKKISKSSPVKTRLFQGDQLLYHQNFDLALEQYREAVRLAPESEIARKKLAEARLKYARHLFKIRRYHEALQLCERVISSGLLAEQAKKESEKIRNLLKAYPSRFQKAQALFKSGNLRKAYESFLKLWETYPHKRKEISRPLAYTETKLGDSALRVQNFRQAALYYEKALRHFPDWFPQLTFRLIYARAKYAQKLLSLGEFQEAERLLTETLAYDPQNDVLHYLLGRALEEQGRLKEAIEHYDKIRDAKKLGFDPEKGEEKLRNLAILEGKGVYRRKSQGSVKGLAEYRTKHFLVSAPSRDLAVRAGKALELHYRRLAPSFGIKNFEKPCKVIIHPTEEEFRARSASEPWAPAESSWQIKLGHLREHRIETYQNSPQLFSSVLPHELTHILLAASLNYRRDIPLWASEGLAIQNEPPFKHKFYREILTLAYKQERLIKVRKLLSLRAYPKEDVELFYAQSFSLTRYLLKKKNLKVFLNFLSHLKGPKDWKTWEKIYGFSNESAVENHWKHAVLYR